VPAGGCARGRVTPPPSKSVTHRYLNLALLAGGQTDGSLLPLTLERPLFAEDTRLFLAALPSLGFDVEESPGAVRLTPAGAGRFVEAEVFCGNAGTMLRFLTAALTAIPGRFRLDGSPRLRERPVGPLVAALRRLGAVIACPGRQGYPPLEIEGGTLRGGRTTLDAGESSQYLSALLMAALAAPVPVEIEVGALISEPYVGVTLAAATAFGGRIEAPGDESWLSWAEDVRLAAAVRPEGARPQAQAEPVVYRVHGSPLRPPARLRVEGDWSAACYPAAAAALTGGEVTLAGLEAGSRQGDRGFLDLLAARGAEVEWRSGEVTVRGGALRGIDADLSSLPDQVPTLAALAPFAAGTTRIGNVAHLRLKESDRLAAMASELRQLGAEVEEGADSLAIPGVWHRREPPADSVVLDPHDDHRIAMSLALAGLRRPGVRIASPEVVGKSYPGFWDDLDGLLQPA
jgi:3-phosphoshikimate 1-carboxyvinyltransferase